MDLLQRVPLRADGVGLPVRPQRRPALGLHRVPLRSGSAGCRTRSDHPSLHRVPLRSSGAGQVNVPLATTWYVLHRVPLRSSGAGTSTLYEWISRGRLLHRVPLRSGGAGSVSGRSGMTSSGCTASRSGRAVRGGAPTRGKSCHLLHRVPLRSSGVGARRPSAPG